MLAPHSPEAEGVVASCAGMSPLLEMLLRTQSLREILVDSRKRQSKL